MRMAILKCHKYVVFVNKLTFCSDDAGNCRFKNFCCSRVDYFANCNNVVFLVQFDGEAFSFSISIFLK